MAKATVAEIRSAILKLVPKDGSSVGNKSLRDQVEERLGAKVSEEAYFEARDALVDSGKLVKGQGRGGSVRRVVEDAGSLQLSAPVIPEGADKPKPRQAGMTLAQARQAKAEVKARRVEDSAKVIAYRHDEKRKNNPDVGVVTPDNDPDQPRTVWAYDPHIDPALQFDVGRAKIESLIDDALASGDEATMRGALEQLKRQAAPYLNWTGKAERTSFEVDTVSLHVHERIDPASILAVVQKRMKADAGKATTGDMFRAWFEEPLPLREAVDFYKHDRGWSNRLVAGDSLLVMNSLLQKEGMAGQVQMIYIDPPYGIKYGSNFQPFVNKREVKDRKDEDLTQEPEMIKAFRDTWELGIHSYLTYLRDRLLLAKELLHESGSVFVQISDENLHHVRELCDEIFGPENYSNQISFNKNSGLGSNLLPSANDYIVWYAKDISRLKFRPLFTSKSGGDSGIGRYNSAMRSDGRIEPASPEERLGKIEDGRLLTVSDLTKPGPGSRYQFSFRGTAYSAGDRWWGFTAEGLGRAARAGRIVTTGKSIASLRFLDDAPMFQINNVWTDIGGVMSRSDPKIYVVQTSTAAIENCVLMTSDPGDIVLDPTCGSGTTAYVAEKWGRRWITCDTSRVAVTLAKQRLMTACYDYYDLKYPHEGLKAGFIYKTVPHVTLKSIVNNPEIDEIWGRMHPAVEAALIKLNSALAGARGTFIVTEGGRKGEVIAFDAKGSHTLPTGEKVPANALLEWEVPFDFPPDWPAAARAALDAFHTARQAMQQKMDDSIAAHADQEVLMRAQN